MYRTISTRSALDFQGIGNPPYDPATPPSADQVANARLQGKAEGEAAAVDERSRMRFEHRQDPMSSTNY